MNIILIVLCGTLMGAFNLGFFLLGYYLGTKKENSEGVTVTKENQEFIEEMMKWKNFNGGI